MDPHSCVLGNNKAHTESPGATREAHPERRTDSNGGVPPHSPAGELRFRAGELRFRRRAHVAAPRKGSLRSTQIQRAWQPTRGGVDSFKCGAAEVERAAQTVGGCRGARGDEPVDGRDMAEQNLRPYLVVDDMYSTIQRAPLNAAASPHLHSARL